MLGFESGPSVPALGPWELNFAKSVPPPVKWDSNSALAQGSVQRQLRDM